MPHSRQLDRLGERLLDLDPGVGDVVGRGGSDLSVSIGRVVGIKEIEPGFAHRPQ